MPEQMLTIIITTTREKENKAVMTKVVKTEDLNGFHMRLMTTTKASGRDDQGDA